MENKINYLKNPMGFLFSDEEMGLRTNADREDVVSTFAGIEADIVNGIMNAGNKYLQYAEENPIARREHNFAMVNLHGLIIEELAKVQGVTLDSTPSARNTFLRIGSYLVWLKKLDEHGKPKINRTKSSAKRINQKAEGDDTQPMLILGYKLDDEQRIVHISISYMEGDKHLWPPIDIGNRVASSTNLISNTSTEEAEVRIRSRKKKIEAI